MKNGIRVTICVMLVVAVLAMSLSVIAVDEGDRIVSAEYLWAYYIYQFLHSIGIDVTYQGVIEYTDQVQDTIIDWVINYIADLIEADSQPSNYSIAQWIAPWQAGYDYWGNLQFNSTMLEDMQDFAEWLKSELSLVDNSTIIVNPNYSVNGYTIYKFNTYYPCAYLDGTESDEYVAYDWYSQTADVPLGYFIVTFTNSSNQMVTWFYVVNDSSFSQNGRNGGKYVNNNGEVTEYSASGNLSATSVNSKGTYYSLSFGSFKPKEPSTSWNYLVPNGLNLNNISSDDFFDNWLPNAEIREDGDTKVIVSEMMLPIENPDYTSGDGVTIIDGVPQYGEITFNGVIENLPAIVSTGTVSNPGLETFWGFIPVLAEQTKDAIVLTRGLIYELPEELVVTFYAVMGGLILFGVIKLMREH